MGTMLGNFLILLARQSLRSCSKTIATVYETTCARIIRANLDDHFTTRKAFRPLDGDNPNDKYLPENVFIRIHFSFADLSGLFHTVWPVSAGLETVTNLILFHERIALVFFVQGLSINHKNAFKNPLSRPQIAMDAKLETHTQTHIRHSLYAFSKFDDGKVDKTSGGRFT